MRITIHRGDITQASADAIVNAANSGMLGGGGVDGAIHRAAGRDLVEACRQFPKRNGMRCPPGEARITPGFNLPARYVIHTVGPRYKADPDPAATLANAHRASIELAREAGVRVLAFPAISCGVYGYPLDEAAAIAITTARQHGQELEEIQFVLYDAPALDAWTNALNALNASSS